MWNKLRHGLKAEYNELEFIVKFGLLLYKPFCKPLKVYVKGRDMMKECLREFLCSGVWDGLAIRANVY